MKRMQLARNAAVMIPASVAGDLLPNHKRGACWTSLRTGIQQRRNARGAPTIQTGPLAIMTATSKPMKLASTLPRNILPAAAIRGRPRSNTVNRTDFTMTAPISTRIDLDKAKAGTMTCMNGRTGSHASAGLAVMSNGPNESR
jgi:hypothetical protein